MSEKSERYAKLLKKNLGWIVVGVLAAMAGGMFFILTLEQNAGEDEGGFEPKVAVIDDVVVKNPLWPSFKTLTEKPDMTTSYPHVLRIRRYNMFDYKNVADQQTVERNIAAKMTQAQEAEKAGKNDDAIALAQEVLKLKVTHKPARDLIERLQAKKAGAPAPGAPGAPPPARTPSAV